MVLTPIRDIIFYENHFPYTNKNTPNNGVLPLRVIINYFSDYESLSLATTPLNPELVIEERQLRRKNRKITKPRWLQDFVAQVTYAPSTSYSIALTSIENPSGISFPYPSIIARHYSHEYIKCVANVSKVQEHKNYHQVKEDSN